MTDDSTGKEYSLLYNAQSSDDDLRKGCLAGDRRAREFFYRRYYGKLIGIPMRYLRNKEEANQVFNQALLRIFTSLGSYREEGSFQGWMSTIVFRTTMSYLRGQKEKNLTVSIDDSFHHPAATGGIEELHDVEEIYRHVQQLPDALRSVFSLFVVDDFSHEEIAGILGISVGNSRWRLAKARERLRTSLRREQEKTA